MLYYVHKKAGSSIDGNIDKRPRYFRRPCVEERNKMRDPRDEGKDKEVICKNGDIATNMQLP